MKKYGLFGDEDDDKPKYIDLSEIFLNPYKGDPILEQIDKDFKKTIKLIDEEFERIRKLDKERKRDLDRKLRFDCDRAGIPTLLED